MIPQTFGESARRVRHRFDHCPRRPDVDRELSRGRAGSGAAPCASALRFRTRPPHAARRTQHAARSTRHAALGTRQAALRRQPSALGTPRAALGRQHSAGSTPQAALGPRHAARRTRHSALGTRHSAGSTQQAALSRQHSAGSTPQAALRAKHSALRFGFCFGPQPRPSHSRTVRSTESCRHPFVSSERARTPQPRSLGPVRPHSSGAPMIPRTSAPRVASRPNAGRKDVRNTRSPAHEDLEPPT